MAKFETESAEITNRFSYHPPKDDTQLETYQLIRNTGLNFALFLLDNAPAGRERSLAITKIEEAVMWANAGIARG